MIASLPGPALLFCPADRPDRFLKACALADMVILDLEDAVSPEQKVKARTALAENPLDPTRTIVRINGSASTEYDKDIAALRRTPYEWVMLPKAERQDEITALSSWKVIALCETARGIVNAAEIASAPNLTAMMWGAEDLIVSLHGTTSRDSSGTYRHIANHARSTILLSASSAGILAVDSVYLDTEDVDGLAVEAEDAAASGFGAKACIHPAHVPIVRSAFMPNEEDLGWARRVLARLRDHKGVFVLDGQMIDAPLIRQAQELVDRATKFGSDPPSSTG